MPDEFVQNPQLLLDCGCAVLQYRLTMHCFHFCLKLPESGINRDLRSLSLSQWKNEALNERTHQNGSFHFTLQMPKEATEMGIQNHIIFSMWPRCRGSNYWKDSINMSDISQRQPYLYSPEIAPKFCLTMSHGPGFWACEIRPVIHPLQICLAEIDHCRMDFPGVDRNRLFYTGIPAHSFVLARFTHPCSNPQAGFLSNPPARIKSEYQCAIFSRNSTMTVEYNCYPNHKTIF
jgi:hypothetical protein